MLVHSLVRKIVEDHLISVSVNPFSIIADPFFPRPTEYKPEQANLAAQVLWSVLLSGMYGEVKGSMIGDSTGLDIP